MVSKDLVGIIGHDIEISASIQFDDEGRPVVDLEAPDGTKHEVASKGACCGKCKMHSPHCRARLPLGENLVGRVLVCPLRLTELASESSALQEV
jgi:hypothetical protein